MKARGWHVQLLTSLAVISTIKDLVAVALVPVVFDHFGGAQAALGVDQPGFADLLELVKSDKAYVRFPAAIGPRSWRRIILTRRRSPGR
jgi:predicted TIM-barrel fold metal-dependent hydrolase